MVKKIVQIGDPVLEEKCEAVNFQDPKVVELVKSMLETCREKEAITAGLSAPQVGEKLRICICRRTDLEEKAKEPISPETLWEVLLNPVITKTSTKESIYWEGCLSIGEGPEGLYAPVGRPETIEIAYEGLDGSKKQLKCSGFFSHVVQHEMDHLEGILFLKYVSDPTTIWKGKDLDKYYDKNGEYPPV